MKVYPFLLLLAFLFSWANSASSAPKKTYQLDLSQVNTEVLYDQFKMGHAGPKGQEIKVNSHYITKGGHAFIPVMGEFHFSRYPRELWKDVLLKMKANGINIVATYVIWLHHEEIEGQFEWNDSRDLRHFVKLCAELDLMVYPRIGPWCHGEVRNGGFPDWLLTKRYIKVRSNNSVYLTYVDRWFKQVGDQLKGLLYKNGGPVVGIQLENEYRRGKGGESHILWLKQKAVEVGLDVPLYTVTGWGNASVPEGEVIPLFGGYPAAPWTTHTKKLAPYSHFFYESLKNDKAIGNDGDSGDSNKKKAIQIPNFTCEVGVGNQISYHRRPVIDAIDGAAIIQGKIGSGSNLPGYYVFAGGLNPIGIYTTTEENRDESTYYNDYPDISYDFQAAIGEFGQLAPSYHEVKKIHYWLNDFGASIAPMVSVLPKSNQDKDALQYAVRVKDGSGYVFASNYQRLYPREKRKDVQFNLTLKNEKLRFPSKAINVPDSCFFIWPFNLTLGETQLKYATAQLLSCINYGGIKTWFFYQNKGIEPEFLLSSTNIAHVVAENGQVKKLASAYLIDNLKPGKDCLIRIESSNGQKHNIVLLTNKEATQSWKLTVKGQERMFISPANLVACNESILATSLKSTSEIWGYPTDGLALFDASLNTRKGIFKKRTLQQAQCKLQTTLRKVDALKGAKWLTVKVENYKNSQKLNHKQFIKEFEVSNPSRIKLVRLVTVSGSPFTVNINDRWINKSFTEKKMEMTDITGYVQKGSNMLFVDFPIGKADGPFVGYIEVEFYNTDRIIIKSDKSWIENSGYLIPSKLAMPSKTKAPTIATKPSFDFSPIENNEWAIELPLDFNTNLSNIWLKIDYQGDWAQMRDGHRLLADHYYIGLPWTIGLKNYNTRLEGKNITLKIQALQESQDIYFETSLPFEDGKLLNLKGIELIPEYQFIIH